MTIIEMVTVVVICDGTRPMLEEKERRSFESFKSVVNGEKGQRGPNVTLIKEKVNFTHSTNFE